TLADSLAQMVERGFGQRRQRSALAAVTTLTAYMPPPTVDALAECAQPIKNGVDNLAIGIEISAAFLGDGVELLRAFGGSGDIAGFLQIGQGRIDDAGAGAVPVRGLLFEQLDDLVAVARGLRDQRQRNEAQVALGQHALCAHPVLGVAAAKVPFAATAETEAAAVAAGGPFPAVSVVMSMMSIHFLPS